VNEKGYASRDFRPAWRMESIEGKALRLVWVSSTATKCLGERLRVIPASILLWRWRYDTKSARSRGICCFFLERAGADDASPHAIAQDDAVGRFHDPRKRCGHGISYSTEHKSSLDYV